jgi:predicted lipoprotein with Yx(FWY)xxD motif
MSDTQKEEWRDMRSPSNHGQRRRHRLAALATILGVALAASALVPITATAQDADISVGTATDEDLGAYLVGPDGRTLYYFTRDVIPGVSACAGPCAEAWPPLLVEEGQQLVADESITGWLAAVPREDGTMQAAYRGRPLYYFASDEAAGDVNGQAVNDVWFVATADGSMPANPPALTLQAATSDLGTFLTGRDGLTTYYFAVDAVPGVSTCEGDCLEAWPPVTVRPGNGVAAGDGVTGVIGLITGTDGSTQVTYDGRPLYYWQGDSEEGQTTGHGVGDVWWVAAVDGSLPEAE